MGKDVWVKDTSNGRILKCSSKGPDAYFPLVMEGQPVWRGHISEQHAEVLPDTFDEGRKHGREEEKAKALKVMEGVAYKLQRPGTYYVEELLDAIKAYREGRLGGNDRK